MQPKLRLLFFAILLAFQSLANHEIKKDTLVALEENAFDRFECIDSSKFQLFAAKGLQINDIDCEEIYCEAADWLGVPYKYGQGTKKGTDCSRLVMNLSRVLYFKPITGSAASIYSQCQSVQKDELQEGDLVFFKIGKSYVSHVGIYLQNGKFVHATRGQGVVISDLSESYYKKYFFSGGRLIP